MTRTSGQDMLTDPNLLNLVHRAREGHRDAADELVKRYEPDIRRIARVRLARFGLRHLIDSEDIAQSVFGRFFARLQAGGLEFESGEKVLHLLTVIAANRVTSHARAERNQPRPVGTTGADVPRQLDVVADSEPGVEKTVTARDSMAWLLTRLSPDERHLARERMAGREWAELATELGVGGDALRKRLARALAAVGAELGFGSPAQ